MKKITMLAVLLGAFSIGSTVASANSGAYNAFNAHYINPASCTSCHTGSPGTILQLGLDWKNAGGTNQAGPSTQAGWDALDATYATTYGGVNPNWTLSAATPTTNKASTTGCLSTKFNLMAWMSLVLLGVVTVLGRRKNAVRK